MKYVVFINSQKIVKSNLWDIREPNTTYILIAEKVSISQYKPEDLSFFDHIHTLPHFAIETIIEFLAPYPHNKDNLLLITAEESCLLTLAHIREHLGLPGTKVSEILPFVNKAIMKQKLERSEIRYPKFLVFNKDRYRKNSESYLEEIIATISFPMIAKPLDLSGSRNVSSLSNKEALDNWAKTTINDAYHYEIDEYVTGTLYHCDSIIQNGKIVYFSAGEYIWPCLYFTKGYNIGAIQLQSSDPRFKDLFNFNHQVIETLTPPDGATHHEVFVTQQGEKIFLEIAARPPGGLISIIHHLTTGIHYETEFFKIQLGLPSSIHLSSQHPKEFYAWAYFPKKTGKIIDLHTPKMESEVQMSWFVEFGQHLEQSQHNSTLSEIAGQIIYKHSNPDQLYQDFLTLRNFNGITVKEE